ncbi:MAG: adenylyl-sulfate kinase [Chrysiogenales bacterium]|nr:MAG: adenylyl-sulfate kinase [Chrysiogenales bacterium]
MKGMLKFLTCGSVDDGKSTLIGRILYETGNVYDDQLEILEIESKKIGNAGDNLDFSLLLDGLIAEREQGITIDVAYRYFSTPARKFIVADTPGHVQYTRNMATGASNCDAALLLVDARQGVLAQTRRHLLICALMGIRYVIFTINKMDLIGFDRFRYEQIRIDCMKIFDELRNINLTIDQYYCTPVSAMLGDNCVKKSDRTPWYNGPTVLEWLETIQPEEYLRDKPFRFPIQYIIKPGLSRDRWQTMALNAINPEEQRTYRGCAGVVVSGEISAGDKIVILPSGRESAVQSIYRGDEPVDNALAGDSIAISLADEIDMSRGESISKPENRPTLSNQFKTRVVWMDEQPLFAGRRYIFRGPYGFVNAEVLSIDDAIDLSGYQKLAAKKLEMNEIGEIQLVLDRDVPYDIFSDNRTTGGFILIDRLTNATSACGTILHSMRRADNIHWQSIEITKEGRAALMGQKPCILWFTGLSGSGKSTIANAIEKMLHARGRHTMLLDGDNVRHGLNKDLGFTDADRVENIRRIGEVSKLLTEAGLIVITAFISPFKADREMVRNLMAQGEFIEIFVNTPLDECERRDVKGLYKKARNGEIPNLTGVNSPYETPESPEMTLHTLDASSEELAERVVAYLTGEGFL